MKRHFDMNIVDGKTGEVRPVYNTFDDAAKSLEDVKRELTEWCNRWGHTPLWDTFRVSDFVDVPGFVEAGLNDIMGLKR